MDIEFSNKSDQGKIEILVGEKVGIVVERNHVGDVLVVIEGHEEGEYLAMTLGKEGYTQKV